MITLMRRHRKALQIVNAIESSLLSDRNTPAARAAQAGFTDGVASAAALLQESEALVVKGLLESAGVDSDLTSASLVQDAFPGLGGMLILVREEDAEKARQLIEEYRRAPGEELSEDFSDTGEGGAQ